MTADFFRLLESLDKAAALLSNIHQPTPGLYFPVDPFTFEKIAGSPFAYWANESVKDVFACTPAMETDERIARRGVGTNDDLRFLRLWFETTVTGWVGLVKGGAFGRYYSDVHLAIRWEGSGAELKAYCIARGYSPSRDVRSEEHYFRPGITWPLRTNGLSFRAIPAGCIFGSKGPGAFVNGDGSDELLALTALLNSQAFGYLISLQLARTELAQSYEVGLIQQTPVPPLDSEVTSQLALRAHCAWSLRRLLDTTNETSHAFLLPLLIRSRASAYDTQTIEREFGSLQQEIDDIAFKLYGLDGDDRAEIERWSSKLSTATTFDSVDSQFDGEEGEIATTDDRASLLSWSIGVAFNRFDICLATKEREEPPEPEPFDPLPVKSPGMLPDGATPFHSNSGILVDDPGHSDDMMSVVLSVLDRIEQPAPENLRAWIAKEFFPLHIKMYSKSRRKAPIYWQLATPSGSYSAWLYIHAFSDDTFYTVQNDYVAPKLQHEERKLESLLTEYGGSPTASQRKEIAVQESFVEELRALLEEVKRIVPLWKPDLDDGVIINSAPLWRLFPHNKSWQKEVKRTWDELCAGKYDWAHLAMHFWPERVVPQCATDRSLAIAHGMEEIFWVEATGGKWTARSEPLRTVGEVVEERMRTSTAVKAALRTLMEAPVTSTRARAKTTKG